MEVLLEYKGSRRQLQIADPDDIYETIEESLKKTGWSGFLALQTDNESDLAELTDIYFLQRWSQKWSTFVDIADIEEIQSGDRLTVVAKPSKSPTKVPALTAKAGNLLAKVKKPTKVETKVLSQLFQSSSSTDRKLHAAFDPSSSCVATTQQQKKKASRPKPTVIEVFILPSYRNKVPKGAERKNLKESGRCKKITIHRQMGELEMKNTILREFSHIPNFTNFVLLECEANNILKQSTHKLTGGIAVEKRGALYLYEKKASLSSETDQSIYVSSDDELPAPPKRLCNESPVMMAEGPSTVMTNQGPSTSPDLVMTGQGPSTSSQDLVASERQRYIEEARQIIQEQDQAYYESLKADQEKAAQKEEDEKNIEKYTKLRVELQQRIKDTQPVNGINISLRLPDSTKVDAVIDRARTTKAIYEVAFASSSLMQPFNIYSIAPRQLISPNLPLDQLRLHGSVLIVEQSDEAQDPLITLAEEEMMLPENVLDQVSEATKNRLNYVKDGGFFGGDTHSIRRDYVFDDIIELYESNPSVVKEFPFTVRFKDERAIDAGGVARDALSAFWEHAYITMFDGGSLLIPAVHHKVDMNKFPILGKIISHGYLVCGHLPLRIAFPIIASSLLGPHVKIPDEIILESFVDYLVQYEGQTLKKAFQAAAVSSKFSQQLSSELLSLLSRHGCVEVPKPANVKSLVTQVAHHEFTIKVLAATHAIHSGLPLDHQLFWGKFSVSQLYSLYRSLAATPEKVIGMVLEPLNMNSAEERVFGYFLQFIGNLNPDELRLLLRFITGSSVVLAEKIDVAFNRTSGATRFPFAHTCSPVIDLPSTYATYPDFEHDFRCILSNEHSWLMDSI